MEEITFEPPIYLYHLSGGLRLLYGSNDICWLMEHNSSEMIVFPATARDLEEVLQDYSQIRLLGCNKYDQVEELHDIIADNFSLDVTDEQGWCLAFNQHTHWSGVANGLHQEGKIDEALMCNRLSTQIIKSTRRLEKLSRAYGFAFENSKPDRKSLFSLKSDKYSANIGYEFGSLLDDLYATRDAIGAIVLRIYFNERGSFSTKKLRTKVMSAPTSPLLAMISESMFSPDAGDMLISRMSTYRGVALHCMGTSNPVTHDSVLMKSESGRFGEIYRVIYPLYDDLEELKRIEKGEPALTLKDRTKEFHRFAMLEHHIDALEFGYDCLVRLLRIAELLAAAVPLASQPLRLTEANILKIEYTDKDGKRVRLRRDDASGKLVED